MLAHILQPKANLRFDRTNRFWQARHLKNKPAPGASHVPKPDLGTKRTCPETGKNFYDLNKDPIVSPYTGQEYPLSYFEAAAKPTKGKRGAAKPEDPEEDDDEEDEIEDDADTGKDAGGDDEDEDEDDEAAVELGDDADEVVLESDDDDDDGVTAAKVPPGFTEEGVDDDEDVALDDDDAEFEIDVDDDIDLDDDISDDEDEEKA